MATFSKRNKTTAEYSGYRQASKALRYRLINLYGHPYSGNEFNFGIGNDNWIHEVALSKDLRMNFGKTISIQDFYEDDKTSYDQVFDFIELYFQRGAEDLERGKLIGLFKDIFTAFEMSGSVYTFDEDGHVVLSISDETTKKIEKTGNFLKPYDSILSLYRASLTGLINRESKPKDVIRDFCVIFEDYCKKITKIDNFEKAFISLVRSIDLHPTQKLIIEKLIAYRGDVYGSAHAGKGKEPNEEDALWFIETFLDQINYINVLLKKVNIRLPT